MLFDDGRHYKTRNSQEPPIRKRSVSSDGGDPPMERTLLKTEGRQAGLAVRGI